MEGLVAQGLVKRFRNRVVVDRVSVDIFPGETLTDPSSLSSSS